MIRLSRRYRFSASHRLFRREWNEQQNREVYGKCANPFGHGHDYELEVTVAGSIDPISGRVVSLADLDAMVESSVLAKLRYRNLNEEVEAFQHSVPTTENLALEIDRQLRTTWENRFPQVGGYPMLEKLRIWETERNICEIGGCEISE